MLFFIHMPMRSDSMAASNKGTIRYAFFTLHDDKALGECRVHKDKPPLHTGVAHGGLRQNPARLRYGSMPSGL